MEISLRASFLGVGGEGVSREGREIKCFSSYLFRHWKIPLIVSSFLVFGCTFSNNHTIVLGWYGELALSFMDWLITTSHRHTYSKEWGFIIDYIQLVTLELPPPSNWIWIPIADTHLCNIWNCFSSLNWHLGKRGKQIAFFST